MSYNEKYLELKSSGSLPSPTGTAMKLIELCQQSNVALPEIVHAMQADPGLVGRVLKMANSPIYGRPRPVVSLSPDVLMTIGIQSLRQVVLAFSLVSSHRKGQCREFDYQEFWSRSVAIGVAAELIGAEVRIAPPVEMFTCGLLSQIGKLALAAIHHDKYGNALAEAGDDHERLLQLEEENFGLNHAEISAAMMADWGIPKFFSEAILYQELPGLAGFSENSRRARLIQCFHLAWLLAELCFTDEAERPERMARIYPIGRKLDLDGEMLVSIANQMLVEWKEWSALLEIQVRNVASFPDSTQDAYQDNMNETVVTSEFKVSMESQVHASADILVVDNDPAMVELLKTILGSAGHKVHTAADGREALRMVLEHQPQIMITDWMMPGVDGLQLLRTLRETEIGRYLYVMVLTAQNDKEKMVEAFNAGADDFLVKPLDRTELLARLKAGQRIVTVQREVINECDLLRRNALQLTIANQRAEEAALTDSLTGLYNRRYAMDRLAREWVASERNHRPLSILLLDIDHFKTVNDNHGHNIGDIALKRLAEMLGEYSRRPDIACRIGGEEFFILVPETALPGALRQAERLREAFESKSINVEGIDLRLTISLGVAQKCAGMATPEELLKVADEALYQAKREGRNRVIAAPIQ
ncbi:MAG: diguanylate cyclase [Methylophilaceae bacterium]|jgi:two-component system cell cycle response regulator|nr:diguanylate cyclase [Methylophilaceae bacterium]